jgi:hypothetical protein
VEIGYAWPGLRQSVALILIGLLASIYVGVKARGEGSLTPVLAALTPLRAIGRRGDRAGAVAQAEREPGVDDTPQGVKER